MSPELGGNNEIFAYLRGNSGDRIKPTGVLLDNSQFDRGEGRPRLHAAAW